MKTTITIILVTFALFGLMSCGNTAQNSSGSSGEDNTATVSNTPLGQASVVDNVSAANILQVAMSSKDHTTLVAAVQAAHIEHILANAGPLTVFAPTNEAFAALPPGTVEDLLKPENKKTLVNILNNHAAPGSFNLKALKKEARKGRKIYMANGAYLTVTVKGEDVFVEGAKVIGSIQTSNGVIDVVDKVILPK